MHTKNTTLRGWSAAVLVAGLAAAPSFAQEADPWGFLPARVLEIEGGLVAFRGAVIVDTSETPSLFGKYPTKYILPVTNEAEFPIWVDVEWQVPGQKPFKMGVCRSARIPMRRASNSTPTSMRTDEWT